MNKPERFRAALLAALPELANDPERVSIFVERGRIRATGVPAAGWEYEYQLTVIIQDYAGDMDAIAHAVVQWVRIEQPDVLKNMEKNERCIRFETELLSSELADVSIEMDLCEAVYPAATPNGAPFVHPAEPPADPTALWVDPTAVWS